MPKRLSGSAGTGKKIMQNQNDFDFTYKGAEEADGNVFHTFDWTFGNQTGTAVIKLTDTGYINESSTLNCNTHKYNFLKSLGAYNDSSLYDVFKMMLDSQKIEHQ